MTARAIWRGSLNMGSEKLPVKLYAAVEDRTVHFHVLEKASLTRVKQQIVNPDTGDEVPWNQVQKGFQVAPETYVLLSDEELKQAQPRESRNIDVTKFVPARQIHPQWYDRPYYLGPDEDSLTSYFALVEALKRQDREGIAHWVMRKTQYLGALRSEGGYLMLITMNFVEEVLTSDELPKPQGRPPNPKELKMAEQLVTAMEGEFNPEDFHDEYRERVMKLVEAKAHGRKPKLKVAARKVEPKSLLASLTASIKMANRHQGKKSA